MTCTDVVVCRKSAQYQISVVREFGLQFLKLGLKFNPLVGCCRYNPKDDVIVRPYIEVRPNYPGAATRHIVELRGSWLL